MIEAFWYPLEPGERNCGGRMIRDVRAQSNTRLASICLYWHGGAEEEMSFDPPKTSSTTTVKNTVDSVIMKLFPPYFHDVFFFMDSPMTSGCKLYFTEGCFFPPYFHPIYDNKKGA